MGFDVVYSYYERLPDGKYNVEQLKEMKRKVGDPLDDTSLETLASKILAQLARRDIMVQSVKVYEYSKKEVTFKETQGGIVLKNKKFTLDTVGHDLEAKEVAPAPQQQLVPAHLSAGAETKANGNAQRALVQQQQKEGIPVPAELIGQVPQRVEVFDPEPDHLAAGLVRGKFTRGKRYPIFGEQRDPREDKVQQKLPILYITIDDSGQRVLTPGTPFRPMGAGLIGGDFNTGTRSGSSDGLIWDGVRNQEATDLDRKMQAMRRR